MVQRILCFPGFGQNAAILEVKLAALKQHCAGEVEFVVLDPYHVLHPPGADGLAVVDGGPAAAPHDVNPRRCWGLPMDWGLFYFQDVEPSVLFIRDFLAKQTVPFDGVFGFSQGAAMASLTSLLLDDPSYYPQFLINGKTPHPRMKFAVLVSGVVLLDRPFAHCWNGEEKVHRTPSLHVIGRTDVVVPPHRTKLLIDTYETARVEYHEGGHWIPTKRSWRNFFKTYITSFADKAAPAPSVRYIIPSPAQAQVLQTVQKDASMNTWLAHNMKMAQVLQSWVSSTVSASSSQQGAEYTSEEAQAAAAAASLVTVSESASHSAPWLAAVGSH